MLSVIRINCLMKKMGVKNLAVPPLLVRIRIWVQIHKPVVRTGVFVLVQKPYSPPYPSENTVFPIPRYANYYS
jgi:hypothetical protein